MKDYSNLPSLDDLIALEKKAKEDSSPEGREWWKGRTKFKNYQGKYVIPFIKDKE
jgi:hypothetical protein